MTWTDVLKQLINRESLTPPQARSLMYGWLEGTIGAEVSGAILVALQMKGVTGQELAAMASVLKEMASPVAKPQGQFLLDTCGTGGDGKHTFNISTAVAFVAAAAGIRVAKHGNRSVSSRSGSADVLEALGIDLGAPKMEEALETIGVTFLFAPYWHPAMKAVAPLRKNLGIRTVFNLLGPLVNPYQPTAQVLGVYSHSLLAPMAEALHILGIEQAYVIHSREGLDEAGLGAITDGVRLNQTEFVPLELDPSTIGIPPTGLDALLGGDVGENAVILSQILQGKGTEPQTQCVALNSALALHLAGRADSWQSAYPQALAIVRSGSAWDKLIAFRDFLK